MKLTKFEQHAVACGLNIENRLVLGLEGLQYLIKNLIPMYLSNDATHPEDRKVIYPEDTVIDSELVVNLFENVGFDYLVVYLDEDFWTQNNTKLDS